MPHSSDPAVPGPLAQALGRIPSGLYIVTALDHGVPVGFVGSLLMQVGFAPPTLCLAVAKDRGHLTAIRAFHGFAVSILDGRSTGLMGAFFKKYAPPATAFDSLEHLPAPSGAPLLAQSLAWLDCKLTGEHATADHVVVFATVADGALLRPGDPSVHLRKNGLGY